MFKNYGRKLCEKGQNIQTADRIIKAGDISVKKILFGRSILTLKLKNASSTGCAGLSVAPILCRNSDIGNYNYNYY